MRNRAPAYEWECLGCRHTNSAGSGSCAACGHSAGFTARELDHARGVPAHAGPPAAVLAGVVAVFGLSALLYCNYPAISLRFGAEPTLMVVGALAVVLWLALEYILSIRRSNWGFVNWVRRVLIG